MKDGEINIDGININDVNIKSLREKIGIVPQDSILFNDTIYNNIKYGNLNADKEQIYKAAEIANATDFIKNFPDKFETYIGEKGAKISGGQKQRIAIARAIIKNPDILILDEATSALDSKSESQINNAIRNIASTKTVIVIAHRLSTIKQADKILVFDKGSIIASGKHNELIVSNELYKQLYKLQLEEKNE